MISIEEVVANGACVGCGGCSVATGGRIPVRINTKGYFQADLTDADRTDLTLASRVCPFSNDSSDEDEIAASTFPDLPSDRRTGKYLGMYAARHNDEDALMKSSSGGMTTFILRRLLERGDVDGVVHVGKSGSPMFNYQVSHSVEELLGRRKSQYHPASFAEALHSVRGDGKRYAFVGVPCAVRSARLLAREDESLAEQLTFFVGLVCGHLKSAAYAESFAWQLEIPPSDLEAVDFRIKNPGLLSRQYSFSAKSRSGEWKTGQTISFVGGSWGHAVFQLNACNFCDDIFAETADVVCGDAWLPRYEAEWRGTNVIITRNTIIDSIIREASADNSIWSEHLDVDSVVNTQLGNFRHRREGLSVRLSDDQAAGKWTPRKRVQAGEYPVSRRREALIRQRRDISERSHELFAEARAANDLQVYLGAIRPMIDAYEKVSRPTLVARARMRAQREFWRIVWRLQRNGR